MLILKILLYNNHKRSIYEFRMLKSLHLISIMLQIVVIILRRPLYLHFIFSHIYEM